MKKRRIYKSPLIKTTKIKANFFYSLDRSMDSLMGYCITGGGATCYPPSCASVPGCCTCFLKGTKILMGDKSLKEIQDITVGEKVTSYDAGKNSLITGQVSKIFVHQNIDGGYLIVNNILKVTKEHPIWSDNKWKKAEDLQKGDMLLDKDCNEVEITSIESVEGINTVYNLEVEGEHNYFADNFLVHNKLVS